MKDEFWLFAQLFLAAKQNPRVIQEAISLFDIVHKGGLIMWPILFCSVLGLGVFLERLFMYRQCELPIEESIAGIKNLIHKGNFDEALLRASSFYGPIGRVIRQILLFHYLPLSELREAAKDAAQLEIPKLEAHLPILSTIASISPLLGLLGTVNGMIEAFLAMNRASGTVSVTDLASGIWMALVSTAAGISVAIPTQIAYNFLITRLSGILGDIERVSTELIHALIEYRWQNNQGFEEDNATNEIAPKTEPYDRHN
ncbi:MotA/TolQ/ExbB proton channel family protein [Methylacidiphilum kamchatkense]|uniref:Biopolymer transport protein ExbB n=1 Tax=Methylacidiphilum kamchatkense Kam1 TaxID=1202785 RepID=A0A516TPE5_9BACT|nr:MotA/TolQ/ExbB proton channel family protein [Methylacidiphilum kamchatkense]QDQ43110.1 biopolymer transport protein ExbB [Methylacidiphilum kamchatkense Kam1]